MNWKQKLEQAIESFYAAVQDCKLREASKHYCRAVSYGAEADIITAMDMVFAQTFSGEIAKLNEEKLRAQNDAKIKRETTVAFALTQIESISLSVYSVERFRESSQIELEKLIKSLARAIWNVLNCDIENWEPAFDIFISRLIASGHHLVSFDSDMGESASWCTNYTLDEPTSLFIAVGLESEVFDEAVSRPTIAVNISWKSEDGRVFDASYQSI